MAASEFCQTLSFFATFCRARLFCVASNADLLSLNSNFFCVTSHLSPGKQGCQIFIGTTYQNGKTIPKGYKITQWSQNGPNGNKMHQLRPLQGPPKFTQIDIFGLKIYHLATLQWQTHLCRCQGEQSAKGFANLGDF
jgi:hypothetical protein